LENDVTLKGGGLVVGYTLTMRDVGGVMSHEV